MFPMYKFPSQFKAGDIVAVDGGNLVVQWVKAWEGCTEVRFTNGDTHYLMDSKKYQYQIRGVLS